MKTRLAALIALFVGISSTQVEINYSYEMKYGDGMQVKPLTQDTTDYIYFENLLDINTYYGDNIYIYSQLEYSNPPVFGFSRTGLDSMLSAFYIEYSHERFNVKLGDIYELYGRGLSYYTLQDQNVDYDNSIKGLVFNYSFKENLGISTLIGSGEYAYRSILTKQFADLKINNNVILGSVNYENNYIGDLQFSYKHQSTLLSPEYIKNIYGKSEIGKEVEQSDRASATAKKYFLLPETFWDFEPEDIEGLFSDTLVVNNLNLNWNYSIWNMDIYFDKAWIQYDKIYGKAVFGSRFYTSVYTEFFDAGITYEYKNYYTPYLIKSLSNPPIVYREGSSILSSRNIHSINFGNEIGHQIDLNRNLIGNMNIAANLSLSHRHKMGDMESIGLLDILSMKDEDEMYKYYPFRQIYLEMNGWTLSDMLFYKLGIDYFTEFYDGKNTSALTIPSHWVWKLSSGSSLTLYLETQEKIVKRITPGEYTNHYLSTSYSYLGKWVVTGYYDQEIKDSNTTTWLGGDLSFKLNTGTQVSLFYGSQKGGLVCANGICAEQPGFEDGFKFTFRSLF